MTDHTPPYAAGRSYFFDVQLDDTAPIKLTDHVDLLRQSIRISQRRNPFDIDAAVVLPRRVLMLWTMPEGDTSYSARWHVIKATFRRHAPQFQRDIWQPRFTEHKIRTQVDYDLHTHLIMTAPIRAGLVRRAVDWPWSSLHHRVPVSDHVKVRLPRRMPPKAAAGLPSWLLDQAG
ncbi:REP-associated tyrosine transposase [Yoonia sp. 208BN28-4]|uniref:REP-associated tyrosine transposase n=1 Tax=Yoonia sp. 208BN28-4 TaxID=3126505 RepID=UPI0030A4B4BB